MLSPANLFRLLNELVFVLLGVLLAGVAFTGRYSFHRRAPAWLGLGAFLIYWGLRAWWREGRTDRASRGVRPGAIVRGASLALVGALMLGIAWAPFHWIAPLLGAAGGILVLRGLVSAVLFARAP